jgi:hypothetical protein
VRESKSFSGFCLAQKVEGSRSGGQSKKKEKFRFEGI